jgi:hypothetical protein
MRWFVALVVAASLLTGCKSRCRQLSEKLCDCALNSNERTLCLQSAASKEALSAPSEGDEAVCQALFEQCDCRLVDTPVGKIRCGLARPVDGVDAGL